MIQWILLSISGILVAAVSVSTDVICLGHCSKQCTCSQNYTFQCDDGTCVSLDKYRNHIKDCPDGTDEAFQIESLFEIH
uniref:Uncharacterized protein n=1 Tax=Romanomermis culicivorax TaxID=13658 RepID=A0A915LDT5_ROMCU